MKRILGLALACIVISTLFACSASIDIPNVLNIEEAEALNILSSNGLTTSTRYEASDEIEEGKVIRTEPQIGTTVEKNSNVVIYVSVGPASIISSNATVNWRNMTEKDDIWEFNRPYVEEGVLYIGCSVTFASDFEWLDKENTGKLTGKASLTDSFDKTSDVSAKYISKQCKSNEKQNFKLEIPLKDLEDDFPSRVYLKLYTRDSVTINVNFEITW